MVAVTSGMILPMQMLLPFIFLMLPLQVEKPLIWASDEEGGAPYLFRDSTLEQKGFELDIIRAVSAHIGRPIEFKQYPFDNLIPGLLKGDFDFAMNGLEITEERKKTIRFSKPYYIYRQQLVTRADEKRFQTLLGCKNTKGAIIGTMEATQAERLLDQEGIPKRIYPSPTEAYADLAGTDRIDAVFMDLPMALQYALPDKRLRFAGKPTARGFYGIAFRPQDEELAKKVDSAIEEIRGNGKLRSILVKWNLWDDCQEELSPGFLYEEEGRPDFSGPSLIEQSQSWSFGQYLPMLLEGALVTIQLTASSFALALIMGLPLALARLYGPAWLKATALTYVEFFRGIPVLLLLFFLYFGLPAVSDYWGLGFSISLSPFMAATLGLGLNYAAFEAENLRTAIQSIPKGQWEAAASLGMCRTLAFRRIIMPQALRVALPTLTNDLVALFKDTSIASVVALVELNKQYQILAKSSLKFVELGIITAILYLALSLPLGRLARRLEHKLAPEHK